MKNDSIPEAVAVVMINAARDITVAKINAKGAKFDGYTGNFNWFNQSMKEVRNAVKEVIPDIAQGVMKDEANNLSQKQAATAISNKLHSRSASEHR